MGFPPGWTEVASSRADRVASLGNSVVPQLVEFFGRIVLEREVLRLSGLQVLSIAEEKEETLISIRRRRQLTACPKCGAANLVANGAKRVVIRDMPIDGRPARLIFDRQRFRCRSCAATSYDDFDGFDPRRRMTRRLVSFIEAAPERPHAAVAREVGLDEKSIRLMRQKRVEPRRAA